MIFWPVVVGGGCSHSNVELVEEFVNEADVVPNEDDVFYQINEGLLYKNYRCLACSRINQTVDLIKLEDPIKMNMQEANQHNSRLKRHTRKTLKRLRKR